MKKQLLLTLVLAFVLSGCGGVRATVSNDPYSRESQAIVEKWVADYRNHDAQALLSLYSDDIVWSNCSGPTCDRYSLTELKYLMVRDLSKPDFKVEAQSYFVTAFGYRAVVQAIYSDPIIPVTNTSAVAILEIKDGKIASETWYWATP